MIAVLRMGILHGTMEISHPKPEIFVALPCRINITDAVEVKDCPNIPVLIFCFKSQISKDICEYEFEGMKD